MAIISKITIQKKNKERYNIFLNNGHKEEYAFSVDEAVLVNFQLRKGLEVTEQMIEEILYKDKVRKGYQLAINYLSYRMRSTKEVIDYLKKKELEEDVVSIIINRLKEETYLNDREFAMAFVRSRLNLSLKGPGAIKRELIEKGISETEINESLLLYSYELQLEKATTMIQKKSKISSRASKNEQKRKIYTLLISNGFSQDVAQIVLKKFDSNNEDEGDEEWNAIVYQGEKAFKKYRSVVGQEQKQKVKQYLYRRGFAIELIDRFIVERAEEN